MNSDELIEKDLSFNIGLDWMWKEKIINKNKPAEAGISIGQVIKFNEDPDMPTKSSLQNKNSDLVTKATYLSPGNFDVSLKNTIDNGFNHIYYNDLNLKTSLTDVLTSSIDTESLCCVLHTTLAIRRGVVSSLYSNVT